MIGKNELLTIVIPTRERSEKLRPALESALRCDSDRLRVLVCDNLSTDATQEVATGTGDSRVRYIRTEKRLSMMQNFEFALSHVTEGHVISIGDDDAVVAENIPPFLDFLDDKLPQAVRSVPLEYYWDSHPDPALRGILKNLPVGRREYEVDSMQVLRDSAVNCDPRILCGSLPSIYHGCVHSSVIDAIRRRDGAFLRANCSDFYSAVIVGAYVKRHWMITWPVTLSALSNRSNGASLLHATQKQQRREIELFWEEGALPLHERLCEKADSQPFARVGAMITADNLLRAREKDPSIPAPDLNGLVDICIDLAGKKPHREDFDLFLAAGRSVAERNGLEFESKAARAKYKPRPVVREQTRYDEKRQMFTAIDLTPLGATDALSAARCVVRLEKILDQQATSRRSPAAAPAAAPALSESATIIAELSLRTLRGQITGTVIDEAYDEARRQLILTPPSLAEQCQPLTAKSTAAQTLLLSPRQGTAADVAAQAERFRSLVAAGGGLFLPLIPDRASIQNHATAQNWAAALTNAGFSQVKIWQVHGDEHARLLSTLAVWHSVAHRPWMTALFRLTTLPWQTLAWRSVRTYHPLSLHSDGAGLFTVVEARL